MKRYVAHRRARRRQDLGAGCAARAGIPVVAEAATDVISQQQARGVAEPWPATTSSAGSCALQRDRLGPAAAGGPDTADAPGAAEVHDRSVLCTLALARFLGRPVTPPLAAEVARVVRPAVYERTVFLLRPLGFIVPTAARQISYRDSLDFERLHETAYREHGFELIGVAAASVAERAAPDRGRDRRPGPISGTAWGRGSRGPGAVPHSAHTTWATKRWSPWCSSTSGGPSSPARYRSPHAISVMITGFRSRPAGGEVVLEAGRVVGSTGGARGSRPRRGCGDGRPGCPAGPRSCGPSHRTGGCRGAPRARRGGPTSRPRCRACGPPSTHAAG